jgi:O-antigen biosynthesis protein
MVIKKTPVKITIIFIDKLSIKNDYSLYLRLISVLSYNQPKFVTIKYLTIKELTYKDIINTDVFIFYRRIFFFSFLYSIISFLHRKNKILIYDIDDYLFEIPSYSSAYSRSILSNIKQKWFLRNLTLMDLVAVSTEILRDEILKLSPCSNVCVIPNTLDLSVLNKKRIIEKNRINILLCSSDNLKIKNFKKDFINVLQSVKKNFGDKIKLTALGNINKAELTDIFDEIYPMMKYEDYFNFLSNTDFEIGLVPLGGNEDPEFFLMHSCKSNIKFLEFAKYGICGIYSNVLPYRCVEDHEEGILVNNEYDAWYKGLYELIINKELREKIKKKSYDKVLTQYNINLSSRLFYDNLTLLKENKKQVTNISIIEFILYKNIYVAFDRLRLIFMNVKLLLKKNWSE